MKNAEINQAVVEKALSDGAKNMTEIYRALGGKSKVSSSFSNKIRSICTNVDARLKENQGQPVQKTEMPVIPLNQPKPAKPTKKPTKAKQNEPQKGKARPSKYKRHPQNPFRLGSSYGVAFDILALHPAGMNRDELVKLLAKATGKTEKLAGYDASVVLSAQESPTGIRHRSCKEGFWIHRENKFVKLMLP